MGCSVVQIKEIGSNARKMFPTRTTARDHDDAAHHGGFQIHIYIERESVCVCIFLSVSGLVIPLACIRVPFRTCIERAQPRRVRLSRLLK